MINPITGELCSDNNADDIIASLKEAREEMKLLKDYIHHAEDMLYKMAVFNESKTSRILGEKFKCKIELPRTINWDQKKLASIYYCQQYLPYIQELIDVGTFKVNTREYKKMLSTTGSHLFEELKKDLNNANLGIIGKAKFTIE